MTANLLEHVTLALRDEAGVLHPVNLPHVFVVDHRMVPIIGREALEAFSAALHLDFHSHQGLIEIG